jgi:hypothetical protein
MKALSLSCSFVICGAEDVDGGSSATSIWGLAKNQTSLEGTMFSGTMKCTVTSMRNKR